MTQSSINQQTSRVPGSSSLGDELSVCFSLTLYMAAGADKYAICSSRAHSSSLPPDDKHDPCCRLHNGSLP
jgi:hypothetical protein